MPSTLHEAHSSIFVFELVCLFLIADVRNGLCRCFACFMKRLCHSIFLRHVCSYLALFSPSARVCEPCSQSFSQPWPSPQEKLAAGQHAFLSVLHLQSLSTSQAGYFAMRTVYMLCLLSSLFLLTKQGDESFWKGLQDLDADQANHFLSHVLFADDTFSDGSSSFERARHLAIPSTSTAQPAPPAIEHHVTIDNIFDTSADVEPLPSQTAAGPLQSSDRSSTSAAAHMDGDSFAVAGSASQVESDVASHRPVYPRVLFLLPRSLSISERQTLLNSACQQLRLLQWVISHSYPYRGNQLTPELITEAFAYKGALYHLKEDLFLIRDGDVSRTTYALPHGGIPLPTVPGHRFFVWKRTYGPELGSFFWQLVGSIETNVRTRTVALYLESYRGSLRSQVTLMGPDLILDRSSLETRPAVRGIRGV